MLLRQFFYSIKSFLRPDRYQKVPLGRWDWRICNTEKNLFLANIDSCGDKICGNMKELKEIFKKIH